ncbi:MAG: hypothetical protein WAM14_08110 [Candidatus Nitrosopolaris sp.]
MKKTKFEAALRVKILLPLQYNNGKPIPPSHFLTTKQDRRYATFRLMPTCTTAKR